MRRVDEALLEAGATHAEGAGREYGWRGRLVSAAYAVRGEAIVAVSLSNLHLRTLARVDLQALLALGRTLHERLGARRTLVADHLSDRADWLAAELERLRRGVFAGSYPVLDLGRPLQ